MDTHADSSVSRKTFPAQARHKMGLQNTGSGGTLEGLYDPIRMRVEVPRQIVAAANRGFCAWSAILDRGELLTPAEVEVLGARSTLLRNVLFDQALSELPEGSVVLNLAVEVRHKLDQLIGRLAEEADLDPSPAIHMTPPRQDWRASDRLPDDEHLFWAELRTFCAKGPSSSVSKYRVHRMEDDLKKTRRDIEAARARRIPKADSSGDESPSTRRAPGTLDDSLIRTSESPDRAALIAKLDAPPTDDPEMCEACARAFESLADRTMDVQCRLSQIEDEARVHLVNAIAAGAFPAIEFADARIAFRVRTHYLTLARLVAKKREMTAPVDILVSTRFYLRLLAAEIRGRTRHQRHELIGGSGAPAAAEVGVAEPSKLGNVEAAPTDSCSHSDDFTSVIWFGKRYAFSKGNQARSIEVLWNAWEKGRHSLMQETIGDKIDSNATNFVLSKVFRIQIKHKGKTRYKPHPAWGRMIRSTGKGVYALVPPDKK